ncbi:MAG: DUF3427 domain-containing protein [Planctomycetota bacterium]
MTLPEGLYDQPVTGLLAAQIAALREGQGLREPLHADEAPSALARLVHDRLLRSLQGVKGKPPERLARQLELANGLLEHLTEHGPKGTTLASDQVAEPGERLQAVLPPAEGLARPRPPARPEIPLATSDLLTNSSHDLSLGPELQRELASADRVDLLCSFLKWSGFRLVQQALAELVARRPGGLRVITTAYMRATELRALEELARLGAQIKVSYDTGRTRLHAKAWLFHRESGFSTACIGSSNLSAAAMLDGLEWNVRLSRVDNGPILDKFQATFEQYWDDPEFEPFDPERDAERFLEALRVQRSDQDRLILALQVDARPHQREALDALAAERARGHTRNLLVAATGTGKTVTAALDYRRLAPDPSNRPSLLFVAHRKEILQQSLATYRVVLQDSTFGELLYGGEVPRSNRHVFASIQSLSAERLAKLPRDAYQVLVVDEFHHAEAESYTRLLEHLQPELLLGLTATPERHDGQSVLRWFDERIASELRLWKALDQGLLSPFQYFGLSGPDVRHVAWKAGRYDDRELSAAYRADGLFVQRVLQELHRHVADVQRIRALAFCVDVAHARFMAERFNEAGIEAEAVSGDSPRHEREGALASLRSGSLRVLCAVDLFNEGLDLPQIDTVLFLRPTESATVFLQQLGRGLRRADAKECLTVLDFIGNAHRRFRFDARFRALIGGTRQAIYAQIQRGFPKLPPGCTIQLDRAAQDAVLANVRQAIESKRGLGEDLAEVVRERGDPTLGEFLHAAQLDLEDVYHRTGRTWTELRRRSGLEGRPKGPNDAQLSRALARLLHLDDADRLGRLRRLVATPAPPAADPTDPTQRALHVLLGYMRAPYEELMRTWADLWASPALLDELRQVLALLEDRLRRPTHALTGALAAVPLRVHATYALDEVLAAFDERSAKNGVKRIQTGVFFSKRHRTDLLFVTLEKSPSDYSPTTLYQDYPLSPTRFHWETQSNCHEDTQTARRYLRAGRDTDHSVLLFVRQRRTDARGVTAPYLLLGRCRPLVHRGARPMQIEWELDRPIPPGFYQEIKVAAG